MSNLSADVISLSFASDIGDFENAFVSFDHDEIHNSNGINSLKKYGKYENGSVVRQVVNNVETDLENMEPRQGTFGVVHKMRDRRNNLVYAVKTVNIQSAIIENMSIFDLINEATLLKRMRHPNIVQLYQSIYDKRSGRFHMIMEYIDGGDLSRQISPSIHHSEETLLKWFQQVMQTLDYLHNMRIFHRDIKPENIMLTLHENIKFIDFGSSSMSRKTGTPSYMSFEKRMDVPSRDERLDDIWAVGCTFLELILKHRLRSLLPSYVILGTADLATREQLLSQVNQSYPIISDLVRLCLQKHEIYSQAKDLLVTSIDLFQHLKVGDSLFIPPEDLVLQKFPTNFKSKYTLTGFLESASGHVYKAVNNIINENRTVHIIKRKLNETELSKLQIIHHVNILKHYEYYYTSTCVYMVFEFIDEATSLDKVIDQSLTVIQVDNILTQCDIFWIQQIVQGLEYLHSNGIIHGNIKLENIIRNKHNQIKITGFNISLATTDDEDYGRDVEMDLYLSPEQLQGETITSKDDIWALGCLIIELSLQERIRYCLGKHPAIIFDYETRINSKFPDRDSLLELCLSTVEDRASAHSILSYLKDYNKKYVSLCADEPAETIVSDSESSHSAIVISISNDHDQTVVNDEVQEPIQDVVCIDDFA